jgi:hypothetical protein
VSEGHTHVSQCIMPSYICSSYSIEDNFYSYFQMVLFQKLNKMYKWIKYVRRKEILEIKSTVQLFFVKLLEFLESPNTRKPRVQRAEYCTYTHWVQHSSLGWGYRPSSALTLQTGSIHILLSASYKGSIFKKAAIHNFKMVELPCLKYMANPNLTNF